ncbi:MAG: type II toxin-antitoxin system VapC family toxin [Dermatophilaceae bacterium]
MSLAVVDASVLVAFYAADDPRRPAVVERLGGGASLAAPAHLDAEVVSALRGLARNNPALSASVPAALRHLDGLPLRRLPLGPLLQRIWELRENLTAYDAAYVALAERLDAVMVTCDGKLAAAPGLECAIELIS